MAANWSICTLSDAYLAFNPMETKWFRATSIRYGVSRSIRVTNRKRTRFIITNCSKCTDAEPNDTWYRENLTRLFDYLERLIDIVIANPDGLNDYVEHNLPFQLRIERIAQKEFNYIVPNFKIDVEGRETTIKALEGSVHGISFGNHDHPKVLHIFPHCKRSV